jgi:small subunit ribosomal protein S6
MRHYETIFIVDPDLSDEDYQAALAKSNEAIEKQKGVVVKVQEWGKQRLAYPIKRKEKGSYVVVDYCGDGGTSAELERLLKLDDRILKAMTVKLEESVDPEELLRQEKEAQEKSASSGEGASEEGQESESETAESTEGESNG